MKNKLNLLCIFILSLFLASCQKELTYDELISHPKLLQKKYQECEQTELPQCDMIRRAAVDFSDLIRTQMQDPDAFGRQVMLAQQQLVQLNNDYQKEKTPAAKDALAEQQTKLHALYAVLALHTPE
jgi:hypothetical protein